MYTIKNIDINTYLDKQGRPTQSYSNLLMFTLKQQAKRYLMEELDNDKKYEIISIK